MADLIEIRRRIMLQPKTVAASFTLSSTSNAYSTVNATRYSPGDVFTVTVKSVRTDVIITRYVNGYFNFQTPMLEFGKTYIFTADVDVLEDKLNSPQVGISPIGVGANETVGNIVDGKIRIKFPFTKKSGSNDKFLEFHCGGKSMSMRNVRIYKI